MARGKPSSGTHFDLSARARPPAFSTPWFRRRRHWFVIGAVLAGVIATYLLIAENDNAPYWLNVDILAALQSVIQVVIVIGAAVLSYDRFFRGRTSVSRAELSFQVQIAAMTSERYLHMVSVSFKNIGATTIWYPTPRVALRVLSLDSRHELASVSDEASICPAPAEAHFVVDSGETVMFCASHQVPVASCAVHYEVSVRDEEGLLWYATSILPNRPSAA